LDAVLEPIKRAHSPQLAAGLASVYKLVLFLTVKIPRSLLRGASMARDRTDWKTVKAGFRPGLQDCVKFPYPSSC
jgi:hypothetical protein